MKARKSLLALLATTFVLSTNILSTQLNNEVMFAHYIDVGQADATLLEFPCGTILIDAGAQDDDHVATLIDYLNSFFQHRPELNSVLDAVIITHNHIDHTRALKKIAQTFTVVRYMDNGQLTGPGTGNPNWVRENANTGGRDIQIRELSDSEITALSHRNGLTDSFIDPISCEGIDPTIRILSARLEENPGWPSGAFDNKNNHSIVIRIDFGESSFLFTGDLEEEAIETMVSYYYEEEETDTLDIDVYQVGHHGSHNGTTDGLLEAMSPEIAVFSMGRWDFGRDPPVLFSTFSFGHPRGNVVSALGTAVHKRRSQPITVMVAERAKKFNEVRIRKKLYATGWDGTVRIRADQEGRFRVTH